MNTFLFYSVLGLFGILLIANSSDRFIKDHIFLKIAFGVIAVLSSCIILYAFLGQDEDSIVNAIHYSFGMGAAVMLLLTRKFEDEPDSKKKTGVYVGFVIFMLLTVITS
ncbi:hypothetical protein [Peribacillus muralis]|uniref:hypothetical protein n=1 Tax=Peribacillus muralis TaxID=264697 RepID=UPI00070D69D6|nr:hypothetical protein [Peribacillus muralis]